MGEKNELFLHTDSSHLSNTRKKALPSSTYIFRLPWKKKKKIQKKNEFLIIFKTLSESFLQFGIFGEFIWFKRTIIFTYENMYFGHLKDTFITGAWLGKNDNRNDIWLNPVSILRRFISGNNVHVLTWLAVASSSSDDTFTCSPVSFFFFFYWLHLSLIGDIKI